MSASPMGRGLDRHGHGGGEPLRDRAHPLNLFGGSCAAPLTTVRSASSGSRSHSPRGARPNPPTIPEKALRFE